LLVVVVGVLACIKPLLYSLQIVCWNFVGFHMALFVCAVAETVFLEKPTREALAFVVTFGALVDLFVCKMHGPHFVWENSYFGVG
jgi:hypothetical protein